MLRIGAPFYGTKRDQIPDPSFFQAAEATLFNRADLEKSSWSLVWKNLARACDVYAPQCVSLHFPFNQCDYVTDPFVRARLLESLQRAENQGMAGVVVHAAQVADIAPWTRESPVVKRRAVADALHEIIVKSGVKHAWLALENLPVIGNFGKEIDPTYVYPADFAALDGTQIKVAWDFCHFMITLEVGSDPKRIGMTASSFPFLQPVQPDDYRSIQNRIVHWHFSGFKGLPLKQHNIRTHEGLHPLESDGSINLYATFAHAMLKHTSSSLCMLEVTEENYCQRVNARKVKIWLTNLHEIANTTATGY